MMTSLFPVTHFNFVNYNQKCFPLQQREVFAVTLLKRLTPLSLKLQPGDGYHSCSIQSGNISQPALNMLSVLFNQYKHQYLWAKPGFDNHVLAVASC